MHINVHLIWKEIEFIGETVRVQVLCAVGGSGYIAASCCGSGRIAQRQYQCFPQNDITSGIFRISVRRHRWRRGKWGVLEGAFTV